MGSPALGLCVWLCVAVCVSVSVCRHVCVCGSDILVRATGRNCQSCRSSPLGQLCFTALCVSHSETPSPFSPYTHTLTHTHTHTFSLSTSLSFFSLFLCSHTGARHFDWDLDSPKLKQIPTLLLLLFHPSSVSIGFPLIFCC